MLCLEFKFFISGLKQSLLFKQVYTVIVGHTNEYSFIPAGEIFLLPGSLYAVKLLIASSNWNHCWLYTLKYNSYIYFATVLRIMTLK